MSALIITLHVIVCIALIMIVLLQTGKGADMGAAFGGGSSQTLFGSTGASTFLSKATTIAAVVFMLTSFSLAYMSSKTVSSSIMEDEPAPVEQTATEDTAPEKQQAAESSASAEQSASETPTPSDMATSAAEESASGSPPASADQATAADEKADTATAD